MLVFRNGNKFLKRLNCYLKEVCELCLNIDYYIYSEKYRIFNIITGECKICFSNYEKRQGNVLYTFKTNYISIFFPQSIHQRAVEYQRSAEYIFPVILFCKYLQIIYYILCINGVLKLKIK